ncbi:glycosyl transferase [Anaerobacillus alkalilacustris]|uniref:Glycosyl transferase n=1 Tax=Anaerobacillus alkalilacustris TaxID=393763 RepID=A0A1S2LJQ9_9BACI|nr:glycosyltransferase family 2 protein [Anaerobacillus alkalilacustris]OIJ11705.1 glycosyl transferase [Anaerobacillus alkalilacustris]
MSKRVHEPIISVITPAYNTAKFIRETMDSVIAQTYSSWEMIIVDDCSSDDTVNIVQQYEQKDTRIQLITLQENSGPAVARNTAIRHAKGRYLAFIDSDDQWMPDKLEKQLRFMEDRQIAFSFTEYMNINEDGSETNIINHAPESVTYESLLKNNVIGCLTVMLDTKMVGHVEMVNIRTRQDYVLWLNLSKRGFTPYGLQEVLAKYRIVGNSVSSNKLKVAKQNWKVYREVERLSWMKSAWYFMFYVSYKLKKYMK